MNRLGGFPKKGNQKKLDGFFLGGEIPNQGNRRVNRAKMRRRHLPRTPGLGSEATVARPNVPERKQGSECQEFAAHIPKRTQESS